MKTNQILTSMLVATSLFAASCATTSKSVSNNADNDDVYNTTAQARVYKPAPSYQNRQQDKYYKDTEDYDSYGSSESNYDMDYASRIDRFYYGSPYRNYYDPYYNYYGYNNFGWGTGWNMGWGSYGGWGLGAYYGSVWNNPYYSWNYYGSPYHWNTWGPYSYHNPWGWGGGWGVGNGYWGNGGWGGGYYAGRNENYRPRPTRAGGSANTGINNVPSRGSINTSLGRPTRAENYNPANGRTSNTDPSAGNRPTRPTNNTIESRTPARESYTPPPSRPSYTPPPSNSGSGSSGSGSSGSSGGGGGARPTRGGGRG